MTTKDRIIKNTVVLLSKEGYTGASIRKVADASEVKPSLIYNYFADKETLMRQVRMHVNQSLDLEMHKIDDSLQVSEYLLNTLIFQFRRRVEIVALLQYFMGSTTDFPLTNGGYVPRRAYEHVIRMIEKGIAEGRYASDSVEDDAKAVVHMINGYLMEYANHRMSAAEIRRICTGLRDFLERSLMQENRSDGAQPC